MTKEKPATDAEVAAMEKEITTWLEAEPMSNTEPPDIGSREILSLIERIKEQKRLILKLKGR